MENSRYIDCDQKEDSSAKKALLFRQAIHLAELISVVSDCNNVEITRISCLIRDQDIYLEEGQSEMATFVSRMDVKKKRMQAYDDRSLWVRVATVKMRSPFYAVLCRECARCVRTVNIELIVDFIESHWCF